ncbi:MAG: SGNH/GDSL hydrolase family protein, partial [Clostridia bacterium]|nr:SGNH/GDSL hydrolase family protein [Clostridia bacterium]
MQLTFEDIKKITVGAVRLWEEADGFHFSSMTEKQLAAFLKLSEELCTNAAATTGIRLDFTTDSSYLAYASLTDAKYEVRVDGMLVATHAKVGETNRIDLPADGKSHRVELFLPAHGTPGALAYVELADGAAFARHVYDRKLLIIGDSITQGYNSEFDCLSYANRLADHYNAESIIQGTGGAYYDITTLERLDFAPDTVFVAYGTNDANKFATLAEIEARCRAYLTALLPMYEGARVIVITPPWRMNEADLKPYGHVSLVAERIKGVADELGLTVIDGMKMIPKSPAFMADCYHPNALGFAEYAHNLIKALTKLGL